MRPTRLAFVLISLIALAPAPSLAAKSYDNCAGFVDSVPATITTQGVWCLRADLSTAIASGNAITIATNNVTLDCNDFKLGGLGAGPGTTAVGVYALDRLNATIRNCNVRGFSSGIFLDGVVGGGHLVELNRLDGNTSYGIRISGEGWTVRDNMVLDTGDSEAETLVAFGISGRGSNVDVLDNAISRVSATGTATTAAGIHLFQVDAGSVNDNRIRGLSTVNGSNVFGIFASSSAGLAIRDNDLRGNGAGGSFGIFCGNDTSDARGNVLSAFGTAFFNCEVTANYVNPN